MAEDTKVVETSDEMKFTDEELQELQDLQNGYQEKQAMLGQLAVQRILLDQQSDALEARQTEVETEYEGVQQQERDLVQKLNEKYGPGQLDPATGVFTPAPETPDAGTPDDGTPEIPQQTCPQECIDAGCECNCLNTRNGIVCL